MNRAILFVLPPLGSGLTAQQPPLVGTWEISFPAGMRMENGIETPLTATGVLTIEAKDDSLIATLVTNPSPDLPARPPARLAARVSAGAASFISRTTARLNINGDEREATAVSTWVLEAKGDILEGTVERRLEDVDMRPQAPRPVTGTRRQS